MSYAMAHIVFLFCNFVVIVCVFAVTLYVDLSRK